VIVLTTSESHADVMRSYGLHANCFITKPVDLDAFVQVFHFWLLLARLPRETES
jgi:DNA-binding NarL/FixJ family response regulator